MTDVFTFYHSQYNPPATSGSVGGAISANAITYNLNELFVPIDSIDYGAVAYQYRKFWIKQNSGHYTGLCVRLTSVESTRYFAIAPGEGNDTTTSPGTIPSTLTAGDFISSHTSSITLGSGHANATFPIWIRQAVSSGTYIDELVSFGISIYDS